MHNDAGIHEGEVTGLKDANHFKSFLTQHWPELDLLFCVLFGIVFKSFFHFSFSNNFRL